MQHISDLTDGFSMFQWAGTRTDSVEIARHDMQIRLNLLAKKS